MRSDLGKITGPKRNRPMDYIYVAFARLAGSSRINVVDIERIFSLGYAA